MINEIGGMAVAGAVVAGVAGPVGLAAGGVVKAAGQRLRPRWVKPLTPRRLAGLSTEGADFLFVLGFCLAFLVGYPAVVGATAAGVEAVGAFRWVDTAAPGTDETAARVRQLWGTAAASLVVVAGWLAFRTWAGGGRRPGGVWARARAVAVGVAGFVVLTPVVLAVHLLTSVTSAWVGLDVQDHPLSHLVERATGPDRVAFGLAVCLCQPFAEEVLFRGTLCGWAGGRWYRPWVLVLLAASFAFMGGAMTDNRFAPLGFVGVLAVGLVGMERVGRVRPRFPTHLARSVYSTAALFAAAHSSVWPTPVPLFVLGLGLGYLVVRTNGVTASTIAHGLFNAVSFVFLLRGGGG